MSLAPPKMSEILKEMSERLLRFPSRIPSSEAAHIALFFATAAWNESVGLAHAREGYRTVWETIEADNPPVWSEFKSDDVNAMIDELVRYKRTRYPDDQRRILVCGILDGKIRVEWLRPAAPGIDPQWETQPVRDGSNGRPARSDPLPAVDPKNVSRQSSQTRGQGRRRIRLDRLI